ncbi:MAG TPA: M20 family metallopeptidase [Candidatus Binataceae bacterium]|nr:M20 family metallopeptidase [Candidatus Binataceae bacterium]
MSAYLYEVLERLVAFDTVSSNSDAPAMGFLAARLETHGFKVHLHRIAVAGTPQVNLIAWAGPPRPDGLTISGHLDTVPYAGQPGWTREPLKLGVDADRVWGRGTTDMKGFLAECVAAAAALDLRALTRPLVFIFTSNEEVGCLGAESVCGVLGSILGEVPAPKLVWIGEPTSWQVQHAHKSIVLFDVTVRGVGGHSGAPEQGVNAIAVAGRVLEAIGRLQAERRAPSDKFMRIFPDSPHDVLNVGTIAGGIAANIIAEQCRLVITYRSLPDTEPLEIYREVRRRLAALDPYDYASHNHRAAIEVGPPMVVPPLLSSRDTALERALLEVTGTREVGGALFATDGGWFAQAGMVPLVCGPGDLDQAHKPNESIRRAALESGTEKILKVIARLVQ